MAALSKRSARSTCWECIVYPESAPQTWWEELAEKHVNVLCSPLHDKDVYSHGEKKGQLKKPHWHVLFRFSTLKTRDQVQQLLPCGVQPDIMNDFRASARYLCHLDHKEKAAYDPSLVRAVGLCYDKIVQQTNEEETKVSTLTEILQHCRQNRIYNYSDLINYCIDNKKEWLLFLCNSSSGINIILTHYLRGLYHRRHDIQAEAAAESLLSDEIVFPSEEYRISRAESRGFKDDNGITPYELDDILDIPF